MDKGEIVSDSIKYPSPIGEGAYIGSNNDRIYFDRSHILV
jgi:hypothetical protein